MSKGTPKEFKLSECFDMFNDRVKISYKGPFDKHILPLLGDYIKVVLGSNPKASKKLFSIFIELAQNISYYSAETFSTIDEENWGVGSIMIGEYDTYYTFVTGNTVKNSDIVPVIEKCEMINSLDREGLRKYKREERNKAPGERGGGNIGLIQIALTANNPLDIEVTPIDKQYSFFTLHVQVEK